MRTLLVSAAAWLALLACCLPLRGAAAPADVVPFDLLDRDAVAVVVTLDGAGPFRFIVDTGSAGSVVSDAVAARRSLPAVARSTVITMAGAVPGRVVRLGAVAVGSKTVGGLLADVVPAGRLAVGGTPVDGVLGQDFLGGFNYTLDYLRRRLTWDGDSESDAEVRLPLERAEGRVLVALRQGGGSTVRLVLDSAAAALVMFEREHGPVLPMASGTETVRLDTLGGPRVARRGTLLALRIGPLALWNRPVVVMRRGDWRPAFGDGLLPLHLFARVSIHAREGFVRLAGR